MLDGSFILATSAIHLITVVPASLPRRKWRKTYPSPLSSLSILQDTSKVDKFILSLCTLNHRNKNICKNPWIIKWNISASNVIGFSLTIQGKCAPVIMASYMASPSESSLIEMCRWLVVHNYYGQLISKQWFLRAASEMDKLYIQCLSCSIHYNCLKARLIRRIVFISNQCTIGCSQQIPS